MYCYPCRSFHVLSGQSGVGKSEAAKQLIKDCKNEIKRRPQRQQQQLCGVLEWTFRCDSIQAFVQDIASFDDRHNLQLASLQNIQLRGELSIDIILGELFQRLNERFSDDIKYLIFDDAEQSTLMINHIDDQICGKLDPATCVKWKIIVTTTSDDKFKWLQGCDHVKEDHFMKIEVFEAEETQTFFGRREIDDLQREHVTQLHEKLGGLPLALTAAREHLDCNPVCDLVYVACFHEYE